MASLQGTMVARRLIMEMSQALVSTVEIASSPIPTSNSSSIEDIGSYLLSRSKVKPPTIIVILLLITFFLLGFFSIYFRRWYANGDTTAPPNQPTTPSHNTTLAADLPPPPTTARTTASDLPPLASSKGLDMEIIESLPKIIFSSSQLHPPTNEKKQTECVICLEGFEEEETLRLIPRCGHIFHSECINMWLLSQTSCPLCRHSLLLPLKADKSSTEDEEEGHGGHSLLVVLQSPPHADQHH